MSLTDLEENANGVHKTLSGKAVNTIKQIPTQDETQWYDINIHFEDYDKVIIKIGEKKYKCGYKELGFADCRSKKPHPREPVDQPANRCGFPLL